MCQDPIETRKLKAHDKPGCPLNGHLRGLPNAVASVT